MSMDIPSLTRSGEAPADNGPRRALISEEYATYEDTTEFEELGAEFENKKNITSKRKRRKATDDTDDRLGPVPPGVSPPPH
jgi:hypothetical protein